LSFDLLLIAKAKAIEKFSMDLCWAIKETVILWRITSDGINQKLKINTIFGCE